MLCGLAAGIKSPEKGSGVTLDKLGMLRDNLTGRLEAPGQGEAVRGLWPSVWAAFAATYKDGWRRLLQVKRILHFLLGSAGREAPTQYPPDRRTELTL